MLQRVGPHHERGRGPSDERDVGHVPQRSDEIDDRVQFIPFALRVAQLVRIGRRAYLSQWVGDQGRLLLRRVRVAWIVHLRPWRTAGALEVHDEHVVTRLGQFLGPAEVAVLQIEPRQGGSAAAVQHQDRLGVMVRPGPIVLADEEADVLVQVRGDCRNVRDGVVLMRNMGHGPTSDPATQPGLTARAVCPTCSAGRVIDAHPVRPYG